MSDNFYRAFEERYYAPQSAIKQLRQQYLPFVQPLVTLHPESQTFDLGCGRGEWLEIMTEIGLKPYGVDLDDGMLRACHEKGLPAQKGDAVEYLKTLTSESQLVVTAFHVVEHITFSELRTVVSEALRVLKPGGLLIMETPNPENITVATRNFYLDPTHQRPIPPQLLSFLPEYYGFTKVKVIRLQEDKSLAGKARTSLRDVLGGVSPDYAVVAQKSADDPLLACTIDAFAQEFGLTLDTLVEKFDQQAMQASERAASAEAQAQQASERAASAEAQAQQASERAASAEACATQIQTQLHNVLNSRSWRITAPLRIVGGALRRVRAAIKEQRLISGTKRRIKSVLLKVGLWTMSQPRLKQAALSAFNRMPNMKHRLRSVIHESANTRSGLQAAKNEPGELSPRAARIYEDLKKAIEARKS